MNYSSVKQVNNTIDNDKADNYFKYQEIKTFNTLETKQKRIFALLFKRILRFHDFFDLKKNILRQFLESYDPSKEKIDHFLIPVAVLSRSSRSSPFSPKTTLNSWTNFTKT